MGAKYNKVDKDKALRKLARCYGLWNLNPDAPDSARREVKLHMAVWAVVQKHALTKEYEKMRGL